MRSCTFLPPSSWKRLTFDGSGTSAKITTRIQLTSTAEMPGDLITTGEGKALDGVEMAENTTLLTVETTVHYLLFFNATYTEHILFNTANARVYRRIRQRHGTDPWVKAYYWTRQGVQRRKIMPASPDEKKQAPVKWTRQSQSLFPYPDERECLVISDSTMLCYLLSVLEYRKLPSVLCVFGKARFHRLIIDEQASFPIKTAFKMHSSSGDDRVEAQLTPLVFSVSALPAVSPAIKPEPFSLLGLEKDICIYIDPSRRLPIRVSGVNPKLGNLILNLSDAELK
ncbi:MAG: hypothetical protein RBT11_07965 [Desulfobacterales bacterium]|nr:hypothetical protein [Desulfobacterales bacterium]